MTDKTSKRIRLPFENRPVDWGAWAFDHRVALAVTLIVYLSLGIVFVSGKILVGNKPSDPQIVVDLGQLEELAAQKQRLEEQVRARQQSMEGVRNDFSDANAAERETGERMHNLADEAGGTSNEQAMNSNREAWERGLAQEQAIRDARTGGSKDQASTRARGRVTVSYDIPGRQHRYLQVPAYQCEGGGEVVVGVTVDGAGRVTAKGARGGDDCMNATALRAARGSTFNISGAKSEGTITYIFIPQ